MQSRFFAVQNIRLKGRIGHTVRAQQFRQSGTLISMTYL
jgi:hypothetical protein